MLSVVNFGEITLLKLLDYFVLLLSYRCNHHILEIKENMSKSYPHFIGLKQRKFDQGCYVSLQASCCPLISYTRENSSACSLSLHLRFCFD